jgi:sodium/hydrogen exchanger-like protein 6/7
LLVFHRFLSSHIVTQLLEFNAAGFFTYLLPPVIFYCGLSVEKSRFFLALPSILMYGIVGTLWSFIFISLFMYVALGFALFDLEDCLAMGAIFAATDSVATLQVRRAAPCLCLAGHMSSGGGLCINSKGAWS